MPQKICTNYGKCILANNHEDFSHEKRSLTYCPLCDHKLSEVVPPQRDIASKVVLAVSAVFILFVLSGFVIDKHWLHSSRGANAAELRNSQPAILRISDSNSLQDSMAPAMAEAFFKAEGATDIQLISGADPQQEIVQAILPGDGAVTSIEIKAHAPESAVTALAQNSCDIVGIASWKLDAAGGKSAAKSSLPVSASQHVLGIDGIAVIINSSNPLGELRKDTIKRIFTGELNDWSQVGAPHGEIHLYARDSQSGVFDSFRSMVFGGMQLSPSAHIYEDSNELAQAVSSDPNAIGFVSLPYIHSAKPIAVSDKGAASLKPTRLTVATEDYPLSRRIYLYSPTTPQNAFTQRFIEFALSKQGQDVVAANGFVAQNVIASTQTVSKTAPDEYKQLTQDAERLSLNLRFNAGDFAKDSKAQADLDRVVSMVADEGGPKNKIMLFGFTDNAGSSDASLTTSLSRAKIVEKEFIQRGIKPTVVRGFGSELPVASNDTADGREMNRRVEIWMKK